MRRLLLLLMVLTAACGAAGAGSAVAGTPPRAQLSRFACHRALDPTDRSMSVRAVMRPVVGTRALMVRLDLLQRLPGQSTWHAVTHAGDLGRWLSPRDPTLGQQPGDVWQLVKTVYDLDAPAHYQFRVAFRWLGAGGAVLGNAVQYSPGCAQRELRPDLLVQGVTVTDVAGHPREQEYRAVIANHGATGAGHFSVLFTPGDGGPAQSLPVRRLGAHRSVTETFVGPVCDPSAPPTVVADPTGQVDDYDRDNNTLTVTCPNALSGAATAARHRTRRALS